jgi:uncharacterized protein DUF1120
MRLLKYCLSFFIAAFSLCANAQMEVTVSGKILPPGCNAGFDGGADLNWGAIQWNSLHATEMTTLEAKQVKLNVQCPNGAKVGMAFWIGADPNQASALPGPDTPSSNQSKNHSLPEAIFGLGNDPVTQRKIGNFTIVGVDSSYDGTVSKAVYGVVADGTHSSTKFSAISMGYPMYREVVDWTVWDETTGKPALAAIHTFTFKVGPQLNAKSKLTASQEISFAGAAQFNVRYF